jgi:hypothetical protein
VEDGLGYLTIMADARSRSIDQLGKSQFFGTDVARGDMAAKVIHAANVSLIAYFTEYYFKNDLTRFVWASNDYAFRRRVEQAGKGSQGLSLPFFNLKLINITPGGDRPWANMSAQADGLPMYQLGKKIHLTPAEFTYDLTMYFSTELEAFYNMGALIWDAALETKIPSNIITTVTNADATTTDYTLENIGVMKMNNLSYNTEFQEKEWLEKNKIRAIPVNPTLQTWIYTPDIRTRPNMTSYGISKEIIFKLAANNDLSFVENIVLNYSYLGT